MARICLVTHVVAPWDGQGRVNWELTRYLAGRGHSVTLVATDVDPALVQEPNISWLRIRVPTWLPDPLRWVWFALAVRRRLGKAGFRRFDLVHLNGAIAPVPSHVNTSHFVHASWRRLDPRRDDETGDRVPLLQRMATAVCAYCERRAYQNARCVVAVSDAVREALIEDVGLPARRTRVIYNGVDPFEFRPRSPEDPGTLRGPLQLPVDAFVMIFVGDAKSPRKNLDLALAALADLDARFHLVVVGDTTGGPYPAMAKRLGLEGRTHFLGTRKDVADCFRDADVALCLSHYEPASLVLLEAMASGLPVISAPEVGNSAIVVHGRNGFILRTSTDKDLAVWILESLADEPERCRRMGREAHETAICLTWKRMGRQYEDLYEEVLADRRRPRATPPEPPLETVAFRSVESA